MDVSRECKRRRNFEAIVVTFMYGWVVSFMWLYYVPCVPCHSRVSPNYIFSGFWQCSTDLRETSSGYISASCQANWHEWIIASKLEEYHSQTKISSKTCSFSTNIFLFGYTLLYILKPCYVSYNKLIFYTRNACLFSLLCSFFQTENWQDT